MAMGKAGRVDDHAAHQFLARNLPEWRMRDEERDDVRLANRLGRIAERDVGKRRQFLGEDGQVWIADQNALLAAARQLFRDHDRGALPGIVDIRLVGQAQTGDDWPLEPLGALADLRNDKARLAVVDLARSADQACSLRRGRNDEPRVDGDAVPADPGAWL